MATSKRVDDKETLKWIYKKKGRTQSSWAREIGIDKMTVFGWLHRGVRPIDSHLDDIEATSPDCPLLLRYR